MNNRETHKWPPALIERARTMREAGEFNRAVQTRVADDMNFDRLTLECGHESLLLVSLLELMKDPKTFTCQDCIDK